MQFKLSSINFSDSFYPMAARPLDLTHFKNNKTLNSRGCKTLTSIENQSNRKFRLIKSTVSREQSILSHHHRCKLPSKRAFRVVPICAGKARENELNKKSFMTIAFARYFHCPPKCQKLSRKTRKKKFEMFCVNDMPHLLTLFGIWQKKAYKRFCDHFSKSLNLLVV